MKLGNVVASEYDQSNVRENACSLDYSRAKYECGNVKTKMKMKNRNMKIRYFQIETGPIIWRSLISRC